MNILRYPDGTAPENVTREPPADYTLRMRSLAKGMLLTATLLALAAANPAVASVPGVVILDPASSSQSRAMERQLVRAGYATLRASSDPLAAAASLRRRSGVSADDLSIVGYGAGASAVLATIVEPYDLEVAELPVFRAAVAFGPNCARRYGDWTGTVPQGASGSAGAPHGGGPEPGSFAARHLC